MPSHVVRAVFRTASAAALIRIFLPVLDGASERGVPATRRRVPYSISIVQAPSASTSSQLAPRKFAVEEP